MPQKKHKPEEMVDKARSVARMANDLAIPHLYA